MFFARNRLIRVHDSVLQNPSIGNLRERFTRWIETYEDGLVDSWVGDVGLLFRPVSLQYKALLTLSNMDHMNRGRQTNEN